MNKAEAMLTTAELVARDDFRLGTTVVSPSARTVTGPDGSVEVEPRVMQVLVTLADEAGRVVTRDTLFRRCWGGLFAGDDSLNRAIAGVRRIADGVGGGSFAVETIPRTGYRLNGAVQWSVPDASDGSADEPASRRLSRRQLGASAAGLAVLGGIGAWSALRSGDDARVERLLGRGVKMLRNETPWENSAAAKIFEQAAALQPDNARAWGMLALARSVVAQTGSPQQSAIVEQAADAAERALAIDKDEPNALLAMFELKGGSLDWTARDRTLRRIIALDPRNLTAVSELVALLQSTGLNRESWEWNERALGIAPMAPGALGRRALKLWIAGRVPEADKAIDKLRDLYPNVSWIWWVQFLILALTGRPLAAQAMLDSEPNRLGRAGQVAMWGASLKALAERSPDRIAAARKACLEGATKAGMLAAQAVMILSALDQVDDAFDVANGFLLWRGKVVRHGQIKTTQQGTDSGWRQSIQWLFTPPAAVMRADPRFRPLCDGIGLTEYWRNRRIVPDYLRQR